MLSHSPDVVVIGAGIIGASVAWQLARRGAGVALLDAGIMGGEASWAGAGMLAPGGEMEGPGPLTDFAMESIRDYPRFTRELEAESSCAIDYQRHGAIDLALTGAEFQVLLARAEIQRGLGIESRQIGPDEVHELAPLVKCEFAGALFYPGDELVDPRTITQALRAACASRGVSLVEHCAVESVHAAGDAVDIRTAIKRIESRAAVLACGAWSGHIPVHLGGRLQPLPASFPVRGHLLGYRLAPGSLGPIVRHGHTYVLQRAGGFTIAGTSSECVGFDRRIDPAVVASIRGRAAELVPALASAPDPEQWVGFRPGVEGGEPQVRRLGGTNVWLAYGHYRNGILLAPATAQRVASEIIASLGMGSSAPAANL